MPFSLLQVLHLGLLATATAYSVVSQKAVGSHPHHHGKSVVLHVPVAVRLTVEHEGGSGGSSPEMSQGILPTEVGQYRQWGLSLEAFSGKDSPTLPDDALFLDERIIDLSFSYIPTSPNSPATATNLPTNSSLYWGNATLSWRLPIQNRESDPAYPRTYLVLLWEEQRPYLDEYQHQPPTTLGNNNDWYQRRLLARRIAQIPSQTHRPHSIEQSLGANPLAGIVRVGLLQGTSEYIVRDHEPLHASSEPKQNATIATFSTSNFEQRSNAPPAPNVLQNNDTQAKLSTPSSWWQFFAGGACCVLSLLVWAIATARPITTGAAHTNAPRNRVQLGLSLSLSDVDDVAHRNDGQLEDTLSVGDNDTYIGAEDVSYTEETKSSKNGSDVVDNSNDDKGGHRSSDSVSNMSNSDQDSRNGTFGLPPSDVQNSESVSSSDNEMLSPPPRMRRQGLSRASPRLTFDQQMEFWRERDASQNTAPVQSIVCVASDTPPGTHIPERMPMTSPLQNKNSPTRCKRPVDSKATEETLSWLEESKEERILEPEREMSGVCSTTRSNVMNGKKLFDDAAEPETTSHTATQRRLSSFQPNTSRCCPRSSERANKSSKEVEKSSNEDTIAKSSEPYQEQSDRRGAESIHDVEAFQCIPFSRLVSKEKVSVQSQSKASEALAIDSLPFSAPTAESGDIDERLVEPTSLQAFNVEHSTSFQSTVPPLTMYASNAIESAASGMMIDTPDSDEGSRNYPLQELAQADCSSASQPNGVLEVESTQGNAIEPQAGVQAAFKAYGKEVVLGKSSYSPVRTKPDNLDQRNDLSFKPQSSVQTGSNEGFHSDKSSSRFAGPFSDNDKRTPHAGIFRHTAPEQDFTASPLESKRSSVNDGDCTIAVFAVSCPPEKSTCAEADFSATQWIGRKRNFDAVSKLDDGLAQTPLDTSASKCDVVSPENSRQRTLSLPLPPYQASAQINIPTPDKSKQQRRGCECAAKSPGEDCFNDRFFLDSFAKRDSIEAHKSPATPQDSEARLNAVPVVTTETKGRGESSAEGAFTYCSTLPPDSSCSDGRPECCFAGLRVKDEPPTAEIEFPIQNSPAGQKHPIRREGWQSTAETSERGAHYLPDSAASVSLHSFVRNYSDVVWQYQSLDSRSNMQQEKCRHDIYSKPNRGVVRRSRRYRGGSAHVAAAEPVTGRNSTKVFKESMQKPALGSVSESNESMSAVITENLKPSAINQLSETPSWNQVLPDAAPSAALNSATELFAQDNSDLQFGQKDPFSPVTKEMTVVPHSIFTRRRSNARVFESGKANTESQADENKVEGAASSRESTSVHKSKGLEMEPVERSIQVATNHTVSLDTARSTVQYPRKLKRKFGDERTDTSTLAHEWVFASQPVASIALPRTNDSNDCL